MKPKTHALLCRCIEDGIERGYTRAFKHVDNPTPEQIKDSIGHCIMAEIHESFEFDEIRDERTQ